MNISTTIAEAPTRPALRWHGGKWKLAPWIIGHFPPHRVYVEPFGGGGSVLLRKDRSYAEVYNDLDDDVSGFFSVLRNPDDAAELLRRLRLTPFSRTEFSSAYGEAADKIDRARFLAIRAFMGFGSNGHLAMRKTGFRANSNRSGTTPAHDWDNYPAALERIVERLRGVVVENKDASEVMATHDGPDTLHYVDPPYHPETRSSKMNASRCYVHEMTHAQHETLLAFLTTLQGMVVLSGYPHDLYDKALPGWRRTEVAALADGAADRTEVLWINPAGAAAIDASAVQPDMFAEWSGTPCPRDPDNYWIDDETGERVSAAK